MSNRIGHRTLSQIVAFLLAAAIFSASQSAPLSPAPVLARLDQAARGFTGATASFTAINHIAVLNKDEPPQLGTVVMKRASGKLNVLLTITGEDAESVALRSQTAEVYLPKLKVIQVYNIKKYGDVAQKLMLLGFGTSGRELAANYEVKNLGAEKVASEDTTHLELTPKSAEVLAKLKKVDLWISEKGGYAVQQEFHMPGGDSRLVTYSEVKINPRIAGSAFDLPKGAKRQTMN